MISYSHYLDQVKTRKKGLDIHIFCGIRKKWLIITPEEVVRQAAILYLNSIGYSLNHMSVERQIKVMALYKRYDIVIWDKNGQPLILVECKAPIVSLDQSTVDQAGIYNLTLRGACIWITNGHDNKVFHVDSEKRQYQEIDSIPLKR